MKKFLLGLIILSICQNSFGINEFDIQDYTQFPSLPGNHQQPLAKIYHKSYLDVLKKGLPKAWLYWIKEKDHLIFVE